MRKSFLIFRESFQATAFFQDIVVISDCSNSSLMSNLCSFLSPCFRCYRTREVVLPSIVDKCLGSTRAGTKKNALEIVLLYVEMEDVMASEGPVVSWDKALRD